MADQQLDGCADGALDRVGAGQAREDLADHRGDRAAVAHADRRTGPGSFTVVSPSPVTGWPTRTVAPASASSASALASSRARSSSWATPRRVRARSSIRASSQRAAVLVGAEMRQQRVQVLAGQLLQAWVADGDQAQPLQGGRAPLVAGDLAEHVPLADPQGAQPGVCARRVLVQPAGAPVPEHVLDQAVEAGRGQASRRRSRTTSVISLRTRSARERPRRYPAWNAVSCRESAKTSRRRSIASSLCAASPACRLNAVAVIAAAVRAVNSSTAPALRP